MNIEHRWNVLAGDEKCCDDVGREDWATNIINIVIRVRESVLLSFPSFAAGTLFATYWPD